MLIDSHKVTMPELSKLDQIIGDLEVDMERIRQAIGEQNRSSSISWDTYRMSAQLGELAKSLYHIRTGRNNLRKAYENRDDNLFN